MRSYSELASLAQRLHNALGEYNIPRDAVIIPVPTEDCTRMHREMDRAAPFGLVDVAVYAELNLVATVYHHGAGPVTVRVPVPPMPVKGQKWVEIFGITVIAT